MKNLVQRNCQNCGISYEDHPSQRPKYCSRSCHMSFRNREGFNPSHHRDISGEQNPMFGVRRTGEDNPMFGKRGELAPRWKGGRKIRRDGYVLITVSDNHPYPAYTNPSGTKYVLEHRFIMEGILGRYLPPEEPVHHRDRNPSNNAPENLEWFATHTEHMLLRHSNENSPIPRVRHRQA